MIPVVINTDMMYCGDDLNAVVMLLKSDKVKVVGVMAENGNVSSVDAFFNIKALIRDMGLNIPIGLGAINWIPNDNALMTLESGYFHGIYNKARLNEFVPENDDYENAADLLIKLSYEYENELCIINIAPATNISDAMTKDEKLEERISSIFFMGGAFNVKGNSSPHAEFNIWFDALAAKKIFDSQLPITLLPLDASNNRYVKDDFFLLIDLKKDFRELRKDLMAWDELLVAILLEPLIIEKKEQANIDIVLTKDQYGKTKITENGIGNVSIINSIKENWLDLLY